MKLYHIGLTVSDVKRSSEFYCEVAGFRAATAGAKENLDLSSEDGMQFFQVRSDEFDTLTSNPGSEIKFIYLESPDGGMQLQLIEYVQGGAGALALGHNRPGSPHMSFFVEDVATKRQEVEDRGDVKITSDVIQIAPNMRTFYVEDPDGLPVEFLEVQS